MRPKNFLADQPLKRMIRLAHTFDVGVRIGADQQYVPNPKHHVHGGWRGWIEVDLSLTLLCNTSLTQTRLADIIARKLSHELGHLIIAPPGRRYRKDYGIVGETPKWDLDDAKATLVEAHLLRYFGFESRMKVLQDPLWRMKRAHNRRDLHKKAWRWWKSEGQAHVEASLKSEAV